MTLAYSDIFNFPLTKEEIWIRLVSDRKIKREEFEKGLISLVETSVIELSENYYCLSGSKQNIKKRNKNSLEAEKKLSIAKKVAYYLSFIPSIKFIGISGGLATGNVDVNDDIDFFIITKKNSLFVTRFFALVMLEILRLRRTRNDKNSGNKICLNLLIDEDNLSWPEKMRDLYTAYEIIQIKPLFEKDNIFKRFFTANSWTRKYFKNNNPVIGHSVNPKINSSGIFMRTSELLMRSLQKYYMKKYRTTEIVSKGFIAFHPMDYRTKSMNLLRSKCRNLGLLTKF